MKAQPFYKLARTPFSTASLSRYVKQYLNVL